MQQIAAIQKKKNDKKTAAPVLPVQQEHVPNTEVTNTEPGMPLFLQRFSSASSPPPLQREIDEVDKEKLIFPKLSVSGPDDEYEQEADRVAEIVMRMPESKKSPIKPKSVDSAWLQSKKLEKIHASGDVQSVLQSPGGGRPIPNDTRSQIEPVLNTDLSHVRVHTDSQAQKAARSIHAKAFTRGHHIWLGAGQSPYNTNLLSHEATHVIQQQGLVSSPTLQRWPTDEEPQESVYRPIPVFGPGHIDPGECHPDVPENMPIRVTMPVPVLPGAEECSLEERELSFILYEPVISQNTTILYAVPRRHVFHSIDDIPPVQSIYPDFGMERERESGLSAETHYASGYMDVSRPLPPQAATVDGLIQVLAETPQFVITTTFTSLAVGAAGTSVLQTSTDTILIDAGVNSSFGEVNDALVEQTIARLHEINPSGRFREILLSHGHADHASLLVRVSSEFEVSSIRTNFTQIDMTTSSGDALFRQTLRDAMAAQESFLEERLMEQARSRALEMERGLTIEPDEPLRQARLQRLTESVYRSLRQNYPGLRIDALVPGSQGWGVVPTQGPSLELPPVDPGQSGTEAVVEEAGRGRTTAMDERAVGRFAERNMSSSEADRFSNSYFIRLPNGNHLIVIPDLRTTDISRQMATFERILIRLGSPAQFRIWVGTHHLQSGFITNASSFARTVEFLTRNTGVETAAGGPSGEGLVVSVRDVASMGGDLSRSLVDPATAYIFESLGFQIYANMRGADVRVIEALVGQERVGGVIGEQYITGGANDPFIRRAGSALTWLEEQIDNTQGNRSELQAEKRAIQEALETYREALSGRIGRSQGDAASRARSEIPVPLESGDMVPAEARAPLETILARVESVEGYEVRPIGRVPDLSGPALAVLGINDAMGGMGELGHRYADASTRAQAFESELELGTQVPRTRVMEYLAVLEEQASIIRAGLEEADNASQRTVLEAEQQNLQRRITAARESANVSGDTTEMRAPTGEDIRIEVTTDQAVRPMGRVGRGAQLLLEHSSRPLGAFMVVCTIRSQENLEERIRSGHAGAAEQLVGLTHNAYGMSVGIRMFNVVKVSPYEFVVLAVMDVAQTALADYPTPEQRMASTLGSTVRNGVNLGLMFASMALARTGHPVLALASFALMFGVDPLLRAIGFYDALDRWFAFEPNDIYYVGQSPLRDLLEEYRIAIGAMELSSREQSQLRRSGMAITRETEEDINDAFTIHRSEALRLERDLVEAFDDAYDEASTSYVGLAELDRLRFRFLDLRSTVASGEADTNRDYLQTTFADIDRSISISGFTPEQVRDMDQWNEMDTVLTYLESEIYDDVYPSDLAFMTFFAGHDYSYDIIQSEIDWDDVALYQARLNSMFRNARYRLNPALETADMHRTNPLLEPGDPGYRTYVGLLEEREARFRTALTEMTQGRTSPANRTTPDSSVSLAGSFLEQYAGLVAQVNPVPAESSIERSRSRYRFYIDSHDDYESTLERMQALEAILTGLFQQNRYALFSSEDPSQDRADELRERLQQFQQHISDRRNRGYIYISEISSHISEEHAQEDRRLIDLLAEENQMPAFSANEIAALQSDELEDYSQRATTPTNQIALWRSHAAGSATSLYLLHDPDADHLLNRVSESDMAVVGDTGRRSEEMWGASGCYHLVSVVPLNRAAVNAISRSLHGERILWGGPDIKWAHPDILIPITLEELERRIQQQSRGHRGDMAAPGAGE